jgi:hypothetical protein
VTAGVPGAGIAGLFYLVGALLAPLWSLLRRARGGPSARSWTFVARLAVMALVMLASIGLAGVLVGRLLTSPTIMAHVPGAADNAPASPVFIARLTVFLTMGTLALVLGAVELLALISSPRRLAARRSRKRRPMPGTAQP